MTLRTAGCDGTDCEPGEYGWRHETGCHAGGNATSPWDEDYGYATDMEDGVAHYRRPVQLPTRQQTPIGEAA